MPTLTVFVDGDYLAKALNPGPMRIRVDYSLLGEQVRRIVDQDSSNPIDLLRTYYYTCPPYQAQRPTPDQESRMNGYLKFRNKMESLPRLTLREGRLHFRGRDANGNAIFQQKRVDLLLGLDIALLSAKSRVTHIALVAGDSDFLPAVEVAKREGVAVWLFHGPRETYSREYEVLAVKR